jgi:hypothetical protein
MPGGLSLSTQDSESRSLAPQLPEAANALRVWLPSWPWLLGFGALLRALSAPDALLHDPDTYLHVTAGRWMLAHHALPAVDMWSHTMPGAPWVPAEWLGELAYAAIYNVTGWGGVIVLTAAAFALATGLLSAFLLRRLPSLPALVATLAGAMLVLPHLLARPHVLALPVLVVWCGALVAARDERRGPPWLALPVIALWANLHGSFMFGLALSGFFASEAVLYPAAGQSRLEEARRWGLFVGAALLAVLCNPNGIAAFVQPLRLVAMPALQAGFVEWRPADVMQFPALAAWLLGAIVLAALLRPKVAWTRLVLLAGLFYMALAHVRHADLLGLVGPLAVAGGLGPTLANLMEPSAASLLSRAAAALARPARIPACALVFALGLAVSLPVLTHPPVRAGDAVTPQAALAAARAQNLTGPVLNSEAYGGFLVFSGVSVFIDGRIEMYGNDFLAAYIAAEEGEAPALATLLDRYRIAWALLQAGAPAVGAFDRMPEWRRTYTDGQAVIFVRG